MKKPRYKPGEHPDYDQALNRSREGSFLNQRSLMSSTTWSLASKQDLKALLVECEGKAEQVQSLLEGVAALFEQRKVNAKNEGKRPPTELPPDLATMKLRSEARLDVIGEEITFIKDRIATFEGTEKKIEAERVLERGPEGAGNLSDGVLANIDFQPVKADKLGVLRIDCPKSPYHGMDVVDYREQIVLPWKKATREAANLAYEKSRDETLPKAERQKWFDESQRPGRAISREHLPPRPEGC